MTDYRRVFPPPYSFILRFYQMTMGSQEDKEAPVDPRQAGFSFVLQKEVYDGSKD